jgi:hypothetical protein
VSKEDIMKTKAIWFLALSLISCFSIAQARIPRDAEYFPVKKGYERTYKVILTMDGDTLLTGRTKLSIDTTYFEAEKLCFSQSTEIEFADVAMPAGFMLGFIDNTGVYDLCGYSLMIGGKLHSAPVTILKFPLKVGQAWTTEDEFGLTESTIISSGEVETGNRRFEDSICILLKYKFSDEGVAWCERMYGVRPPSRSATGYMWYARRIGQVKMIMTFGSFVAKTEFVASRISEE